MQELKEEQSASKVLVKVFNSDRQTRKGLLVCDFEDLQIQCRQKFECSDITLVVNEDGTEMEDDGYFRTLPAHTVIMWPSFEIESASDSDLPDPKLPKIEKPTKAATTELGSDFENRSSTSAPGIHMTPQPSHVTLNLPDRKCIICTERECDSFCLPCGHTFCLVCALQVEAIDQNCPTCRGEIDSVKSMFYN